MASQRFDHSNADYSPTFMDSSLPRTIAVVSVLAAVLLAGIYLIARGLM
jgi:hypothetical protein